MRLPEILRHRLNPAQRLAWYPPFRAMRIRVLGLSEDWRQVRILLPLRYNRNPGGSMFGGAVACLADPVAALACDRVFPGHRVWTRELNLDFLREGRSDLELRFVFDPRQEREIHAELAARGRATPEFEFGFFDQRDRECVRVRTRVAIRPAGYRP
jgi:acyl-coenzyme A thioesterase PaaI-like protein